MKNQKRKDSGRHMAAITAAILTMSFPMNILAASNRPDDNTYQAPEAPAPNYNKDMSLNLPTRRKNGLLSGIT